MKSVFIFGAGKVGRGLAHALRTAKGAPLRVTLHPARRGLPKKKIESDEKKRKKPTLRSFWNGPKSSTQGLGRE